MKVAVPAPFVLRVVAVAVAAALVLALALAIGSFRLIESFPRVPLGPLDRSPLGYAPTLVLTGTLTAAALAMLSTRRVALYRTVTVGAIFLMGYGYTRLQWVKVLQQFGPSPLSGLFPGGEPDFAVWVAAALLVTAAGAYAIGEGLFAAAARWRERGVAATEARAATQAVARSALTTFAAGSGAGLVLALLFLEGRDAILAVLPDARLNLVIVPVLLAIGVAGVVLAFARGRGLDGRRAALFAPRGKDAPEVPRPPGSP
ncbi:MAG TPA: hypothetical protein VM889_14730 [Candidatus Thermoplasmatota archaeon]|nr:hypothetical protein [Candidatus Thermoplasmatota archaeon]